MDPEKTREYVYENFQDCFVTPLSQFIRIPNLSPMFDPEFHSNGLIQEAIQCIKEYAENLGIEGLQFHCFSEEGIPPMAVLVYEGSDETNVMLYGHLDKQPHLDGWRDGTGPISPAVIDGRLYGRGSVDDGYVSFALLLAIRNALNQGAQLPRIALVLETEEESGSSNLEYLLDKWSEWIGKPDIWICLDTGVLDYSTLWLTSSLRGIWGFNLKVSVTKTGVHSGGGGGIIPETFRIANALIDRIEDPETKRIKILEAEIPERYLEEAKNASELLGESMYNKYSLLEGWEPYSKDNYTEMYLNKNWRPSLAITGAEGLPSFDKAGNVIRPSTSLKLVFRLPPTLNASKAWEDIIREITKDPPQGAKVEITGINIGNGFWTKNLSPKTSKALNEASLTFFSKNYGAYGAGGSIPFLQMLGDKFTSTEILSFGILNADSYIHAPNENLNLSYAKEFIWVLSHSLVSFL